MRIGIVGAGFGGLAAAKVLSGFGHQVTVFDRVSDVGGVWSRTRRYPGVTTQNNKGSYAFSDFPMPRSYPEWPSGAQVQAYLVDYVRHFGLASCLRLNTEVRHAGLDRAAGLWTVQTESSGVLEQHEFDYLVVANGSCSDPFLPDYEGIDEFRAAGGRFCHTSDFTTRDDATGRAVVVVGYGKSACDVAVSLSDVAASTTVVARHLIWKMPKRLGNLLNYKYLMLTRLGEALFPYHEARGFEGFLQGKGQAVTSSMVAGVQALVVRQLGLRKLKLVPAGSFPDIARSTVSLTTDEFYQRVESGQLAVLRDSLITRLLVWQGRPSVQLGTGQILPADIVVCGTGFRQRVPFLPHDLQRELMDERGNFQLYRQILPLTVPNIGFVGYNSSFFSPLGDEAAALWIADQLAGGAALPSLEERRALVERRLRWMDQRTEGTHSHGTNVIPFSMHNIDEILSDIGVDVGPFTRLKQWLLPIDPSAYRTVARQLHRRYPVTTVWRAPRPGSAASTASAAVPEQSTAVTSADDLVR